MSGGRSIRVQRAGGSEDIARALAIRQAVFVEEQGVPAELEQDGLDEQAQHFLACVGPRPAATARVRRTSLGYKLERVAVEREYRGRSVGAALVAHVLEVLGSEQVVYLHAQRSAVGFWERLGFVVRGEPFWEAGIEHLRMTYGGRG